MFSLVIEPRFSETDALGHVNNTSLPVWFEQARTPIFRFFTPGLEVDKWKLILAKTEVEFLKEIFYGQSVEVKTFIERIGNSSFVVGHEVWQENLLAATGRATLVNFDHDSKKSKPIPDSIKIQMSTHLI
jgi:acyl-CoA thioester hydrolase